LHTQVHASRDNALHLDLHFPQKNIQHVMPSIYGKDSPLVKELYALFHNGNILPGVKLAEYRKKHFHKIGPIDGTGWQAQCI